MKRGTVVLFVMAVATLEIGPGAHAVTYDQNVAGQICEGSTSTDRTNMNVGDWMVGNESTSTTLKVYCGLWWHRDTSQSPTLTQVVVFDRNATSGTTGELWCKVSVITSSSSQWVSAATYTCDNQPQGCTSAQNENPNTFSQASAELMTLDMASKPVSVDVYNYHVQCKIPPRSGNDYSGIEMVRWQYLDG